MSEDLVLIKRKTTGGVEVVKIAIGDTLVFNDVKFKINYVRQNPVRISMEPVPFEENGEVDGNAVKTEVAGI